MNSLFATLSLLLTYVWIVNTVISNFKMVSSGSFDMSENNGGLSVGWCYRQCCFSGGKAVPPLEINDTVGLVLWKVMQLLNTILCDFST